MATEQPNKSSQRAQKSQKTSSKEGSNTKTERFPKRSFASNVRLQAALLAAFAFLLYAQTITFDYAADDGMVILGHNIVQKGVAGIPELLTGDSFRGLDEAQGRTETRRTYRPLSFITFAMEYQFFGKNAPMSHLLNVALYATSVVVMFFMLRRLLTRFHELLPFAVCLVFAAHPIHTEVVANIKSRDEILALLFLCATLLYSLKYLETQALKYLTGIAVCCVFALLSKESAITFLPTIPLALYLWQKTDDAESQANKPSLRNVAIATAPLIVVGVMYLLVWFGVIGRVEDKLYYDTLNNPFIGATSAQAFATKTAILGLYLAKSFFPVTLSTGYTYNEIPLVPWQEPSAFGAAILLGVMFLGGLYLLVRRHILALALLGWCCTMLIASNYVVYAGGLLGERFLFTPTLFSMLGLVWGVFAVVQRVQAGHVSFAMIALLLLTGVYSAKTFARSADWKTTETLLQSDVQNTPNSIHLRRMYGGLLLRNSGLASSQFEAKKMLRAAQEQFREGLRINASIAPSLYNGIGNTFIAERRTDSAIAYYLAAYRLDTDNDIYRKNLSNALTSRSVQLYSKNTPEASFNALETMRLAIAVMPTDSAYSNLGAMFASLNQTDSAIVYLEKALSLNPALQRARKNLALCYRRTGDTAKAARLLVP